MTEAYNGKGLYRNYFYHTWKTFSISPFSNAIMFTDATPSVTSVTVAPSVATLKKGSAKQFLADVEGTGFINESVTWSITGQAKASKIDTDGIVTIASDETATTITVTAKSVQDTTKTGTATITVVA